MATAAQLMQRLESSNFSYFEARLLNFFKRSAVSAEEVSFRRLFGGSPKSIGKLELSVDLRLRGEHCLEAIENYRTRKRLYEFTRNSDREYHLNLELRHEECEKEIRDMFTAAKLEFEELGDACKAAHHYQEQIPEDPLDAMELCSKSLRQKLKTAVELLNS